jgi:hypothetical protein
MRDWWLAPSNAARTASLPLASPTQQRERGPQHSSKTLNR